MHHAVPAEDPALAFPVDLAVLGTAVLPQGTVPDAAVLVRGEEIVYAGPRSEAPAHTAAETLEAPGLVLPGLVDLHCHGGGGVSFPDCASADEARIASTEHLRHGTTSLVGSLVTAPADELRARVAMLSELVATGDLAALHLEGPVISPVRAGAQNPAHIARGDARLVAELCAIAGGAIATMTLAPETEGAQGVMEALAAAGAVPSLGHTDAGGEQMERGIEQARAALAAHPGRSRVPTATHLFNGMRPIHHRDPGPALACLAAAARGEMVVELIGDGVHLDPATVRFVMNLVGPGGAVLVTDAMAAAGMPDGAYRLGSLDVTVADGVARLADGGSIAGGTSHLVDVVRTVVDRAGVDLAGAVHAASAVPARVLGLEHRIGSLRTGLRADVLVTTADLRPVHVVRAGRRIDTAAA